MAISTDIRKRLLYAKYLLSRARRAHAERGDLNIALSLLLMHDAAEMLMLAVADHLQVPMPKRWDFMDFWTEIKKDHPEPPQRLAMEQMNKMRVALKHNGTLPHGQTVRDFLPRLEVFFEEVVKGYLDGTDFAELSLADLIENDSVRKLLREAELAFARGEKQEAFVKLKLGFDTLMRKLPKELQLIKQPPPIGRVANEVRQIVTPYHELLGQTVHTVNLLSLGIDPIKSRFFGAIMPTVSWSLTGVPQVMITRQYENLSKDVFETCVDYVIDVSLRINEVFSPSAVAYIAS